MQFQVFTTEFLNNKIKSVRFFFNISFNEIHKKCPIMPWDVHEGDIISYVHPTHAQTIKV